LEAVDIQEVFDPHVADLTSEYLEYLRILGEQIKKMLTLL
jgi:hypothetical protein